MAKSRLGAVLSPGERKRLMCSMLDHVIAEARAVCPVSVLTADKEVAVRARSLGVDVLDEGKVRGLCAAARLGMEQARRAGEMTVMILVGDLPDVTARSLEAMLAAGRPRTLVIAPSRDGGTNAVVLASHSDFQFAFGPGSCALHCVEAGRLGLAVVVHESSALSFDIDLPDDLIGRRDLWEQ